MHAIMRTRLLSIHQTLTKKQGANAIQCNLLQKNERNQRFT